MALLCYLTLFTSAQFGDLGDEGLVLTGAKRILSGEMVYTDFFCWVTPGVFYLLAGAWKIFSAKYIVARILTVIFAFLDSVFIYLTSRKLLNRPLSILNVLIFITIFYQNHLILSYYWIALLAILVASHLINLYLQNSNTKFIIFSAISLAIGFFFLQTTPCYAAIAIVLFLFWYGKKKTQIKNYLPPWLMFMLTFGLSSLLTLSYFIWKSGFNIIWFDIIVSNLTLHTKLNAIIIYKNSLFFFNLASFILLSIVLYKKRGTIKNTAIYHNVVFYYIVSLIMLSAFSYTLNAYHFGYIYNIFTLPLLFYVAGLLIKLKYDGPAFYKNFFYLPFLFLPIISVSRVSLPSLYFDHKNWQPLETKIGTIYLSRSEQKFKLTILNKLGEIKDDYIFIYPYNSIYYTLADKKNPTRFDQVFTNYLTDNNKEEIKKDILNKDVRHIMYLPAESLGWDSSFLDRWLQENFTEQKIKYDGYNDYFYIYTKK